MRRCLSCDRPAFARAGVASGLLSAARLLQVCFTDNESRFDQRCFWRSRPWWAPVYVWVGAMRQKEKPAAKRVAKICRRRHATRTSAFDSAFFRIPRSASADFLGQRPWPLVEPSFLACAVRPTPPQYRRNTMHRRMAMTSSRYFFASASSIFLIAMAVSRMFLKCVRRSDPRAFADFVTSPSRA
jgi:hypothetical protein